MPENRPKTGRRATRTSFQPGQSGNPGGRNRMTPEEKAQLSELEAACRKKTIEALKTILELMQKADKDSVRLHAAIFVIERGWGKAIQPNEHNGRNGRPIDHHITVEIIKGSAPIQIPH